MNIRSTGSARRSSARPSASSRRRRPGAAGDAQAQVARQAADERAEDAGLDQAGDEVVELDGVERVAGRTGWRPMPRQQSATTSPPNTPMRSADDGDADHHHRRRQHARDDEEADRVDRLRPPAPRSPRRRPSCPISAAMLAPAKPVSTMAPTSGPSSRNIGDGDDVGDAVDRAVLA